jgi:hypothetical protein
VKSLEKSNQKLKKLVSALQKCEEDNNTDSSLSSEGTSHFQKGVELLQNCNPKIVLALKSKKSKDLDLRNVLLLDNQSTFDLCCNKRFTSKIFGTSNPLIMTSNGGGLKITEKCRIPGYKYEVWFSKKAITNIICLKNLIKCYRVTMTVRSAPPLLFTGVPMGCQTYFLRCTPAVCMSVTQRSWVSLALCKLWKTT